MKAGEKNTFIQELKNKQLNYIVTIFLNEQAMLRSVSANGRKHGNNPLDLSRTE